ncbi:ribose 5-phosphate isomerase B [Phaeodactylibacter xiamenensis]|jgi:ribose 5-phosphate isomerase B|uniref:ribose 5-phosphate isomerase B n=1 Tax=Phaeodactylibacter xiamenensis TaxID=1524460 RepID=UPI0024A7E26C|nr:ribose 5-phosphate isomerase B [Phaeodactylibacter xiamenensis]
MEDAKKTIAIGCDHAGYPYKDRIIAFLESEGWTVRDFGTDSPDSVDYPDFVHPTAEMVESGEAQLGIVLCGSGNGVAITANKHQEIRAALCWLPELASLAREHNNANMLALPVRFIEEETAVEITRAFLAASFEGGRHARRVGKIACG